MTAGPYRKAEDMEKHVIVDLTREEIARLVQRERSGDACLGFDAEDLVFVGVVVMNATGPLVSTEYDISADNERLRVWFRKQEPLP